MNQMMSAVDMEHIQPMSRTYQYRKVMKPMLERKRRARINRCLDELKELMVAALQAEGENVSKLEKADILELTVSHLHKLRRQQRLASNPITDADRFRAGFTHCATEVSRCLAATPGVDIKLGTKLMTHLGHRLNDMDKMSPLSVHVAPSYTPPVSPTPSSSASSTSSSSSEAYAMPLTPSSMSSSSSHSPPLDCSTTSPPPPPPSSNQSAGLLKVVEVPVIVKQNDAMWRPW